MIEMQMREKCCVYIRCFEASFQEIGMRTLPMVEDQNFITNFYNIA